MTAAAVAQRLGLSEAAVAAFSGTGAEFAQFFGRSISEGEAAVADLTPPPTVPAAPTGVAGTPPAVDRISLGFTAGSDGGSPITAYEAVSTPSIPLTPVNTTDLISPITWTGAFVQGVAYTFRLRAVNAIGQGALSDPTNSITPNP